MRTLFQFLIVITTTVTIGQTIEIQAFADGFSNAVEITHPKDDSRLFIVQKTGQIRILNSNGTINASPFLTISGLSSGSEQGLLGLAFHPNYMSNGFFYVNYTNTAGDTVIARYSVSSNPDFANTSETALITIDQPYSNHNGGSMKFGPNGYLYIAMGDGGNSGDPDGYAQNLNILAGNRVFLGKMLRIDVDSSSPYGIPQTNPFVGQVGKEEIWAIGLRNPWKFSFNRNNNDLWIADVGQNSIEEINKVEFPLTNGLNFGWRCYEGNSVFNTSGCPAMGTMTFPFAQYTHAGGACSVTGGYFYTGTKYTNFQNKYFFADYCLNRIGYVNESGTIIYSTNFSGSNNFTSFGEDKDGELYITNGNTIFKIIDSSLSTDEFSKNRISVYPNPFKTSFRINNPTNIELHSIELFDLFGKSILKKRMDSNQDLEIHTPNLASGIYILQALAVNGNSFKTKLLVE